MEAISDVIQRAYGPYVERIGCRPAPMDDDLTSKVARGNAFVWDRHGVAGVTVLICATDHLLIENVAVHPACQRQGIGRTLLAFAEAHAEALGLPELRLYTNAGMTENLRFYPRLGYTETGRRAEGPFDRVYFSRRPRPSAAGVDPLPC
jgi:ribosomal protein S18 acetylase RimI-like enzyme